MYCKNGRDALRLVAVPLPDVEKRVDILRRLGRRTPLDPDVDLHQIAGLLEGYVFIGAVHYILAIKLLSFSLFCLNNAFTLNVCQHCDIVVQFQSIWILLS